MKEFYKVFKATFVFDIPYLLVKNILEKEEPDSAIHEIEKRLPHVKPGTLFVIKEVQKL